MGKRQLALNEQEIKAFERREQSTRDVHELKRLQAVRLYGSGKAMSRIQELTRCGESSIRQWAMNYRSGGLSALQSQWRGGNANKLSREQQADLAEKLEQYTPEQVLSPTVRVTQGQFWTVSDLQIVVEQWYGVRYQSVKSYRNLLHQGGFSYQKLERVYRSQPGAIPLADFEADLEKK